MKIREWYNDREIFWNDVIKWALKHIHRAGGCHQDTFYKVLEKTTEKQAKGQLRLFERDYFGEGWNKNHVD